MMEKYHDEHDATLGIARELGVGLAVYTYLENARLLKFNEKEAALYKYTTMQICGCTHLVYEPYKSDWTICVHAMRQKE